MEKRNIEKYGKKKLKSGTFIKNDVRIYIYKYIFLNSYQLVYDPVVVEIILIRNHINKTFHC